MSGFVIAVDGPAASGKGTIAQGLARLYGLPHLDTGLLYRAVGYAASQPPHTLADAALVARQLTPAGLDHPALRTQAVSEAASRVAADPEVRAALLEFQRRFAADPLGAVLDGRDIGTVIAPHAHAKLFVTASPEVRAERRWKQVQGQGESVTYAEVLADILKRDERDSHRSTAPLVRADDAALLDTTLMDISQATDAARRIVEAARAKWASVHES